MPAEPSGCRASDILINSISLLAHPRPFSAGVQAECEYTRKRGGFSRTAALNDFAGADSKRPGDHRAVLHGAVIEDGRDSRDWVQVVGSDTRGEAEHT